MTQHDPTVSPRTCYARGCKEIGCIEANAEYQREWRASPSGISRRRAREARLAQQRAQKWRDQAAASVD